VQFTLTRRHFEGCEGESMSSLGSPAEPKPGRAGESPGAALSDSAALRLARAHSACDALLRGRPLQPALDELVLSLKGMLGALLVAADVPSPSGRLRAVAPAAESPTWSHALQALGFGSGPPSAADHSRERLSAPNALESLGITSLMAFPLHCGTTDGVLWLGFPAGHVLSPNERACFEVLAAHLSLALEQASDAPESERRAPFEPSPSQGSTEELIGMAVHELRTPLTPLTMLLHSLDRKAKASVADAELVARARKQVDRLAHMVSDLLDLSRLRRGRLDLRDDTVDLAQTLQQVFDKFAAVHRDVRVDHPPLAEGVHVVADGQRLGTSLLSLLDHVARVSPSSNAIIVELERHENRMLVSFRSSVAAESISRPPPKSGDVARPAELGKAQPSNSERLKGIGVHLAESIIVRQGGTVAIDDEGRGRVTLRASLRIAPAPPAAPPGGVSSGAPVASS
jgi:signal transduction histidine kinase